MRYRDILHEALERTYDKPLVRTVGADFPDTFLHGTARKNLKSLTGERPDSSIKRSTGKEFFDFLFPPEVNEFGAELFLSEPRQPQQANMFSQGRGNTLAVVRLKPGSAFSIYRTKSHGRPKSVLAVPKSCASFTAQQSLMI